MLAKRNNDEKLAIVFLIVGPGLIAYYLWLLLAEMWTICYC